MQQQSGTPAFRLGGDALGLHRVLAPAGALPQAAQRLDNTLPPYAGEAWLQVERLNVDAASFEQMHAVQKRGGPSVAAQVTRTVEGRGKLHNPVTGSGGMLLGRVRALGPEYAGPLQGLEPGTPVATLVSLTLTPLRLDEIVEVRPQTHQIGVIGHACLPSSAPAAALPHDLPFVLALAVLDVCGAPVLCERLAKRLPERATVLVLGAGKAGVLALAAMRRARPDLWLAAVDRCEAPLVEVAAAGLCDATMALDAADPLAVRTLARVWTGGHGFHAAVNMASLPGTEMATVLATRQRGTCLYFGMATSFQNVALGAEGVGADVELLIGNGYADGHAEIALDLVRTSPTTRAILERRLSL
jgi:L-erythro-3,5-diaminohexanoate dehydrogenase